MHRSIFPFSPCCQAINSSHASKRIFLKVTKFNKKKCEEHEAKEAKKREQNMKALERFRNQQEVHSRRLDAFDDMQSALYQLFVFLSIIW